MLSRWTIALLLTACFSATSQAARGTLDYGSLTCGGAPSDCSSLQYLPAVGYTSSQRHCVAFAHAHQPAPLLLQNTFAHATLLNREVQRISLSAGPLWASSGSWNIQGTALLINDMHSQSVFYYDLGSKIAHEVITSDLASGKHAVFATLQATPKGYLVEDKLAGKIVILNEHYDTENEFQMINRGDASTGIVRFIWSWIELGNDIVAYGELVHGQGSAEQGDRKNWRVAIMKLDGSWSAPRLLGAEKLTTKNLTRQHARLGSYPIMATASQRAYMLEDDGGKQTVSEIAPEHEVVASLSSAPPPIDERENYDLTHTFLDLEASDTTVGLYGWKDSLYLLSRRPDVSNRENTIWTLSKLDPLNKKMMLSITLPTSAPHILLIPGPKQWAIVEKGRVEEKPMAEARASAIVLFPASLPESGETQATIASISRRQRTR